MSCSFSGIASTASNSAIAMPENEQLIYKQFAVTFTNLGHAYCEKGNRVANSDRDAASQAYAKAIKALQTAKQNTRFFPKDEYDEALQIGRASCRERVEVAVVAIE